jgi:23S rRNA pseudouridine2605 synthase
MTGDKTGARHGVARTLSKLGLASRTVAAGWVLDGRVAVNGRIVRDPEFPVLKARDRLTVDGRPVAASELIHVLLNKPRGLVTTAADEQGRETVYRCFDGAGLPWLAPVGRLDKASEGLLLFSNDPEWAARITDPRTGPDKTYRVQVDTLPAAGLLARLVTGITVDGERLAAKSAELLRTGEKNAWLEIALKEGRNRHIRRLLEAEDISVLRLIRVAIGGLALGDLPKGQWRRLDAGDLARLGTPPPQPKPRSR